MFIDKNTYYQDEGYYDSTCRVLNCKEFGNDYHFLLGSNDTNEGLSQFINHDRFNYNCKFYLDKETKKVWIQATEYIPPKTELYIDYGEEFDYLNTKDSTT